MIYKNFKFLSLKHVEHIKKLTIKALFYLVGIPEERDFHMLFKHENAYKFICNFERFCLKRI